MRSDYVAVHIVLYHRVGINKAHRKRKIDLFRPDDGDQLVLQLQSDCLVEDRSLAAVADRGGQPTASRRMA